MAFALEWFGIKSRAEKAPGAQPLTSHYGAGHHMDVYGPRALDVKVEEVRAQFEKVAKERHEEISEKQNTDSHAVSMKNAKQRGIMERHFEVVAKIHERLRRAAGREHEYLYDPKDMMPEQQLSFQEWKNRELVKLIERREKQIAVDGLRPDLNRRSYASTFNAAMTTLTPTHMFESAAQEPTHWPKRAYYYPVTDFSQLESPNDKCEEEIMLEKVHYDRKMDAGATLCATGGVIGVAVAAFKYKRARRAHPAPLICALMVSGYVCDMIVADFRAAQYRTDLDDFIIAKNCWFIKNRPEMYQRVRTGISDQDGLEGLWDRSKQGGLGERGTKPVGLSARS